MIQALSLPFLVVIALRIILFIFVPPKGRLVVSEDDTAVAYNLRVLGLILLALGMVGASIVYKTADPSIDENRDVIGYEVGRDYSYPIRSGETKKSNDQLERIGGKANVVATEMNSWFGGLWQGRKFAFTLGVISIATFLFCFFLARVLSYPRKEKQHTLKQSV